MSNFTPAWFKKGFFNESLFCDDFLSTHQLLYVNGAFFTPDGRMTDTMPLRSEIFEMMREYVGANLAKKVSNVVDVLKLAAQVEDFTPVTDRIALANGTLYLDGTFQEGKPEIVRNRLPVKYDPKAAQPVHWLRFLSDLLYPEDIPTVQEFIGYETIYIPAGRSILTLLSSQWNYLYSTMDDAQKSLFDECTRDYIENVLLLKSLYAHDYERKVLDTLTDAHLRELSKKADELRNTILKGHYLCENGTERIELANNSKVDLNFASSGQQEVVWVLNFLYMRLVTHRPSYFIIEEPESNLFPASQKYVTELISLVVNAGHSALVTTHSPYVLGTMNNLLYAYSLPKNKQKVADSILSKDCWIDSTDFRAYFVEDGTISDCIDHEINQIDSSKMDAISSVVNEEYDRLSMLTWDSEGKDV